MSTGRSALPPIPGGEAHRRRTPRRRPAARSTAPNGSSRPTRLPTTAPSAIAPPTSGETGRDRQVVAVTWRRGVPSTAGPDEERADEEEAQRPPLPARDELELGRRGGDRRRLASRPGPRTRTRRVRGSHWSHLGRYQFQSPSSFIDAGRSTPRTIVASIRIAVASPTPNCLNISIESVAKTDEDADHDDRGARDDAGGRLDPVRDASSMLAPRWNASRIRLRRKTW